MAMESTHVYWILLYEMLESRGIEALLVNARHLKKCDSQCKASFPAWQSGACRGKRPISWPLRAPRRSRGRGAAPCAAAVRSRAGSAGCRPRRTVGLGTRYRPAG